MQCGVSFVTHSRFPPVWTVIICQSLVSCAACFVWRGDLDRICVCSVGSARSPRFFSEYPPARCGLVGCFSAWKVGRARSSWTLRLPMVHPCVLGVSCFYLHTQPLCPSTIADTRHVLSLLSGSYLSDFVNKLGAVDVAAGGGGRVSMVSKVRGTDNKHS